MFGCKVSGFKIMNSGEGFWVRLRTRLRPGEEFMVYGLWFMVYGLWFIVDGL